MVALPEIYFGIQVCRTPKLEFFKAHTTQRELKDIKNELNSPKKFSGVGGSCPSGVSSSSRQTDENQEERKHKPQSHSGNRYTATYRGTFPCQHRWAFLPGMERASSCTILASKFLFHLFAQFSTAICSFLPCFHGPSITQFNTQLMECTFFLVSLKREERRKRNKEIAQHRIHHL